MSQSATSIGPSLEAPVAPALRVGLLGCGVVGSAVARRLLQDIQLPTGSVATGAVLQKVAVLHLDKPRPVALSSGVVTGNAVDVVKDPEIDVVIELIGGIHPATDLILQAIAEGKHVITANKDVIAEHGPKLQELAHSRGVSLRYEGAVGGAVPIIGVVQNGLATSRVQEVCGILNGTSNFILTEMERSGCSFEDALRSAQELGYTEANPAADVEGRDAVHKLVILTSLTFGVSVSASSVPVTGIGDLSLDDLLSVASLNRKLRLVASARDTGAAIEMNVEPVALPTSHPLALLEGSDNGVIVRAEGSGELYLRGQGAGGEPTASAVLSDLVAVARNHDLGHPEPQRQVAPRSREIARFLVTIDFMAGADEAESVVSGAFFGHGVGLDELVTLERDGRETVVCLTESTDRDAIDLVAECFTGRGAKIIHAFPAL